MAMIVVFAGCGEYMEMICFTESAVPKYRAKTPNTQTMTFFQMTQLKRPNPLSQYVTISIITCGDEDALSKASAHIRRFTYRNEKSEEGEAEGTDDSDEW